MQLKQLTKYQRSIKLRAAARQGDEELVAKLLRLGVSTKSKTLALSIALAHDEFKIVAELYEVGGNLPKE